MDGKTALDFQLEILKIFKKYYENIEKYVQNIKSVVKNHDPNSRIILFGSYVKGSMRKDSDIDVLIITDLAKETSLRVKLRIEIAERIGHVNPFELHIVSFDEYESWYKRFIDKYIEI
ncbi:MAG: nucleotidyltransferase domain-containing protein [Thermoproteota archaeon]